MADHDVIFDGNGHCGGVVREPWVQALSILSEICPGIAVVSRN